MTVDEALEYCKPGRGVEIDVESVLAVLNAVKVLADEVLRLRKELAEIDGLYRKGIRQ